MSRVAAATTTLGVVVAAAGRGLRLGAGRPKQYLEVAGRPLLEWTLLALSASPLVSRVVVACDREGVADWTERLKGLTHLQVEVTSGGDCRPLSVRNALARLLDIDASHLVAVHDGARPGFSPQLVAALVARLDAPDAPAGAVPGFNPADTLKETAPGGEGYIRRTLDRASVYCVQTPQVFRRDVLALAYAQSEETLRAATDDAALVEALGGKVAIVAGEETNFKVTTPSDLRAMEMVLSGRASGEGTR